MRPITKKQAARFLLLRHGLLGPYRYAGKEGALDFIRGAGCIQYDPIDVCGRNAELVLQSRVKGFKKGMLHDLLYRDRLLLDHWDKCMAIIPKEDWPYFSRKRAETPYNYDAVRPALQSVREAVAQKGPCCSDDLESGGKIRWPWGSAPISRAALETLYFQGELIVCDKKGTRKYYDLASRHLPEDILFREDPNRTEEAFCRWNVLRRTGSVGLLWNRPSDAFLGINGLDAKARTAAFEGLCADGELIPVAVEGIRWPLYLQARDIPLLDAAVSGEKFAPRCEFIAPLDNLMWDRRLVEAVFGFSYRWEIYTPPEKRQYGYYVLPVVYGEGFLGRIEAVCDRKGKRLVVENIWPEPGKKLPGGAFAKALNRFMRFNGCDAIERKA